MSTDSRDRVPIGPPFGQPERAFIDEFLRANGHVAIVGAAHGPRQLLESSPCGGHNVQYCPLAVIEVAGGKRPDCAAAHGHLDAADGLPLADRNHPRPSDAPP